MAAREHRAQSRHQSRKIQLTMEAATSDIRAEEFTPNRASDSPLLAELLEQIPEKEPIGTLTVDGAYETRRWYTAIIERQATAFIPIRKNK